MSSKALRRLKPAKEPAKEAEPEDPVPGDYHAGTQERLARFRREAREEENARLAAEQRAKALGAQQQQQLVEQLTTDPVGALKSMGFTEEQD